MIRNDIRKIIKEKIKGLQKEKKLPEFKIPEILIEKPKEGSYGDYSTNIVLIISKIIKKNPVETAKTLSKPLKALDAKRTPRRVASAKRKI